MKKILLLMSLFTSFSYGQTNGEVEMFAISSGRGKFLYSFSEKKLGINGPLDEYLEDFNDRWDLLYNNDYFSVNLSYTDNSHIYDLGKRSCKSLTSTVGEENRKNRPLYWLRYSDLSPLLLVSANKPANNYNMEGALINDGHCYLINSNNFSKRLIALFHVKYNNPGRNVVIDEIEVLDLLERK